MDVHPPHEPIHTWRDFFVHLATITIGLLIALGLEATVEFFHHRHLVAQARETIHREIEDNRSLLTQNLDRLKSDGGDLKANVVVIRQLRDHPRAPHGDLRFNLAWSSFTDAAWRTAHDTGALTYMPSDEVQALSQLYGQQSYLNSLGTTLFTDQGRAPSILASEKSVDDLQLDQLAKLMDRTTDLSAQIDTLEELLPAFAQEYVEIEKTIHP